MQAAAAFHTDSTHSPYPHSLLNWQPGSHKTATLF